MDGNFGLIEILIFNFLSTCFNIRDLKRFHMRGHSIFLTTAIYQLVKTTYK